MFGSTTIDIVIGLVFIYLLLGLITSIVVEFLASLSDLRAQYLKMGLDALLKDPVLVDQFCAHPMIESLMIQRRFPPYVPARAFALAILALVRPEGESAAFGDFRRMLYALPGDGATGNLKRALLTMADDAGEDLDRLRHNIEFWYLSTMDRVAGLYKQRVQTMAFIIALVLTGVANLDSGAIAKYISRNSSVATSVRASAHDSEPRALASPSPSPTPFPVFSPGPGSANYNSSSPTPTPRAFPLSSIELMSASPTPSPERAGETGLPIGWSSTAQFSTPLRFFSSLLGWLFTALAATVFALFWFDILNKFVLIRSAVKPQEERVNDEPNSGRDFLA